MMQTWGEKKFFTKYFALQFRVRCNVRNFKSSNTADFGAPYSRDFIYGYNKLTGLRHGR